MEALVVFQQTLTGEEEDVVAELLITLKVDFKQPFISYGQDLSVFYALDRSGSPVIGRKEAKFSHEASGRDLDVDLLDQEFARHGQEHFVGGVMNLEQGIAAAIFAFGHERLDPLHRHVTLRRATCLLNEPEQLAETNGIDRQQQQIKQKVAALPESAPEVAKNAQPTIFATRSGTILCISKVATKKIAPTKANMLASVMLANTISSSRSNSASKVMLLGSSPI